MRHITVRAILCATTLIQGLSAPAIGATAPCVNCAKSKAAAADEDAAPPLTLRAKPVALRQCAGVYFSAAHSAWFEVDCLVPLEVAQVGVLVLGDVPQAGKVRLWITRVYEQPKTSPPGGVQGATAPTDASAQNAGDDIGSPEDTALPNDSTQRSETAFPSDTTFPSDSAQPNDAAQPSESLRANEADDSFERDPSAPDRNDTVSALDGHTLPLGSARFHLRLPPGARLIVEGQRVASWPLEREVVINHLAAKRLYEYHFVVEAPRDGQMQSFERTVGFTAGDEVLLDFTADAALAAGK
jgi:uncharacterized protein (TIGR03000 family)